MKIAFKVFAISLLVAVPAAVSAQVAKAGNALYVGAGSDQQCVAAADPAPAAGQKTRTKSNNANDRAAAPACTTAVSLAAGRDLFFRFAEAPRGSTAKTYRLRIWRLVTGAAGELERAAAPTIDVAGRSGESVSINSLTTGPCEPPYLCTYDWEVAPAALDSAAHPETLTVNIGRIEFKP